MTDIKSNQQDSDRGEITWKTDVYSQHSMNNYIQQLATSPGNREQLTKIVGGISANVPNNSDNLDKEESDSLSGYSDDENHKRKQRRYR